MCTLAEVLKAMKALSEVRWHHGRGRGSVPSALSLPSRRHFAGEELPCGLWLCGRTATHQLQDVGNEDPRFVDVQIGIDWVRSA